MSSFLCQLLTTAPTEEDPARRQHVHDVLELRGTRGARDGDSILPLPFPGPSPLIGTYRIYNKSVSTRPIDLFPKRRSAVRPLPPLPARAASPYPHCTLSLGDGGQIANFNFDLGQTDEWQSFLNGHRLINAPPPPLALRLLPSFSEKEGARVLRLGNE